MPELIEIHLRGTRQLEEFRLRQTRFVDAYLDPLGRLRDGIASTPRALDRDERILYALGRLVFEDFFEVVVNCANGMTTGAMKIQRGMYERAVTLLYLDRNPTQIEKFFNYFYIADWKRIHEAHRLFPDSVPEELYNQAKHNYEAVREGYKVPACRDCARKKASKNPEKAKKAENTVQPSAIRTVAGCTHQRDNLTWSDLDLVSMSNQLEDLKGIRLLAYYINMEETHPTVHAVLRRFADEDETGFSYSEGHLREHEGTVLLLAHHLVISAARVLWKRFGDDQADNQLWELCMKHLHEHYADKYEELTLRSDDQQI